MIGEIKELDFHPYIKYTKQQIIDKFKPFAPSCGTNYYKYKGCLLTTVGTHDHFDVYLQFPNFEKLLVVGFYYLLSDPKRSFLTNENHRLINYILD